MLIRVSTYLPTNSVDISKCDRRRSIFSLFLSAHYLLKHIFLQILSLSLTQSINALFLLFSFTHSRRHTLPLFDPLFLNANSPKFSSYFSLISRISSLPL
ncbi:hypothetical protein RJT34_26940 [Clitoria ternatea]|uniref:Uncharacterized protein n=1 Tax=Clitoria ternatea TaxID=43366 RepID=A0AAN9F9G9_CLITE